ncbi:MAG TPA: alpha-amylase family glycosyl hydrolase [Streptosporangiaceae bacterium]|nr:alpha-amylase family glycosyl hydrolase [Streptosporangiaceae bacterium]
MGEYLDYLAWLGVTAVWLNPWFVSPDARRRI